MIVKRKNQLVTIEPYGLQIIVLCGSKEKSEFLKLNGAVEHVFTPESDGCYWYGAHNGETSFILWVKSSCRSVLMHESIHLAHCVMDFVGIPISIDNTEVEAYLACQIFEHCAKLADRVFK